MDDVWSLPDAWAQLVELYLVAMMAAGRAPGTVRLHRHYLGLLARCGPDPGDIDKQAIEAWLSNPAWQPETRKSARTVATMFYRWAALSGHVDTSPALGLMPVTVPPGVPKPAPQEVYEQAFRAARGDVRIMLALARYAGLRCCEIAAVHSRDLTDGVLFVTGKGGKQRIVPILSDDLTRAILGAEGWVFASPYGGHVTAGWVSKLMARALPGEWTGHKLRHAFATRSYAVSPDVLALGRVLGHSKPETTMRYVQSPIAALRLVVSSAA